MLRDFVSNPLYSEVIGAGVVESLTKRYGSSAEFCKTNELLMQEFKFDKGLHSMEQISKAFEEYKFHGKRKYFENSGLKNRSLTNVELLPI